MYSDDEYDENPSEDAGEWAEECDSSSEEYDEDSDEWYDNVSDSGCGDEQSGEYPEIAVDEGQENTPVDETSLEAFVYDIPYDPPEYVEAPKETGINPEEPENGSVTPASTEDDYAQSDIDGVSLGDTAVQEDGLELSAGLNETSSGNADDYEVPTDFLPVEARSENEGISRHDGLAVEYGFLDAEDYDGANAMQLLSESTTQSGVLIRSGDHFGDCSGRRRRAVSLFRFPKIK